MLSDQELSCPIQKSEITRQLVSFPIYRSINNSNCLRWYVFYTKPNSERIAYNSLLKNQYEVFLPEVKKWKTWKNRQRKLISTPIFPSYIFIRTTLAKLPEILMEDKIVSYIKFDNNPVHLKDEQIVIINVMAVSFTNLAVNPTVRIGQKVRVINGNLAGYEGIVVCIKGKFRFGINISALNLCASVEMDSRDLELLN